MFGLFWGGLVGYFFPILQEIECIMEDFRFCFFLMKDMKTVGIPMCMCQFFIKGPIQQHFQKQLSEWFSQTFLLLL